MITADLKVNVKDNVKDKPQNTFIIDDNALMFLNRFLKNWRHRIKWAKRENITAYRCYDRDLPNFNVAIDRYGQSLYIQEYHNKRIDVDKTQMRINQILILLRHQKEFANFELITSTRRKQLRYEQYQKQAAKMQAFQIKERDAVFWVDLAQHIDTGLYLDHRPIRHWLHQYPNKHRILNLYAYTGSATIAAALGGSKQSVSVDLSKTYLRWAKRNFIANRLNDQHQLVHSDVENYLHQAATARNRKLFDIILLDPPTFSNSKRTSKDLDVQKDHHRLIALAMKSLSADGVLVFSTHARKFKLDTNLQAEFQIENYCSQTIDLDFKQNPNIHYCWLIRHAE